MRNGWFHIGQVLLNSIGGKIQQVLMWSSLENVDGPTDEMMCEYEVPESRFEGEAGS